MTDSPAIEPTRTAGQQALARFLPNAGRLYARSRNFDFGPERRDNVSVLSPYVRHRLLSEDELLREVLQMHSYTDAQKFVEEVYWRTYFKGWLEHHPDVWTRYRADLEVLVETLEGDRVERDRYNQAVAGRTGIDCFDAWAEELVTTGYLHNHARMWFASIWVFTLNLPWQLGADFFLRHLLDGDPASNTLGWRWVCGLHTRGKTYLARVSNIANFTNYRFNPAGQLATSAPPLTEKASTRRVALAEPDKLPQGDFGLLVTEEDCSAEAALVTRAPGAVLGLTASNDRSVLPVSPLVYDFARDAVADAVSRAGDRFECPAETGGDRDWANAVRDWCRRHDIDQVVTAWAPTGPVCTRLTTLEAALEADKVRLLRIRRSFDSEAWPYAGRGYFKLKRQIPSLLEEAGVEATLLETA
jgi:deoxyribodipyrimidine photo-lyase